MKTFVAILFIAATVSAQTVSVGAPAGRCGQSVTVPVSIDNVSGLLSVEFTIAFDNASLAVANVGPGTLTSGFSTSWNVAGGNALRVAMASGSPVSGSGTIANVAVNVAAAASGNSALTISNVLINDVPRSGTPGAVAITCPHAPARPPLPANARVLPIAGSAAGAFGSSYRTSVQLYNACGVEMEGMMIFHLLGASGGDDDPSLAYRLGPGETLSYPDLVAALGVPPGLGSLDIVPSGYQQTPWTVVRIFNDAGASGTTGMTFDALGVADALMAGQRGVVVAPIDPNRARMNIGIRTLRDGATITITVKDRRGATISTRQESYPATYLTQFPATGLTGDEVLLFDVEAGGAIVYASTNDNVTQDPSVQIARPLPPMP